MTTQRVASGPSANPTDDDLRHLAALWTSVFDHEVDPADVSADFVALGGEERVDQLGSLIAREYGPALTREDLLATPSLYAMAAAVKRETRLTFGRIAPPTLLAPGEDGRTPVFLVAAMGATVVGWRRVVSTLDSRIPVYAMEATGFDEGGAPMHSVRDIAAYRIAQMRELVGRRPVVLAGHSFGGSLAMEMALQLSADDQEVRGVVLLDTSATTRMRQERNGLGDLPRVMRRRLRLERKSLRCRIEVVARRRGIVPTRVEEDRVRWVIEAQRLAFRSYRRRPYSGTVTVLRARRSRQVDATLNWQPLVDRPIEVHELPGDHSKLLSPDWAHTTAAVLERCLLPMTVNPLGVQ